MKILVSLVLAFSTVLVFSAQDSANPFTVVSPVAPVGLESPEYSIMVVYSWSPSAEDQPSQIAEWGTRLEDSLASSNTGFRFASRSVADEIQFYFYVSDLEHFRLLSNQAGELLVNADVNYSFARDLNWATWESLRGDYSENIRLALLEEE